MPFLSSDATAIPDAPAAAALAIATSAAEPAVSVVALAGELLHSAPSSTMRAAAAVLSASGIVLARLTLDRDDSVLSVDPTPDFDEGEQLNRVANRVSETIYARLRTR
jgi:hypothetical protein